MAWHFFSTMHKPMVIYDIIINDIIGPLLTHCGLVSCLCLCQWPIAFLITPSVLNNELSRVWKSNMCTIIVRLLGLRWISICIYVIAAEFVYQEIHIVRLQQLSKAPKVQYEPSGMKHSKYDTKKLFQMHKLFAFLCLCSNYLMYWTDFLFFITVTHCGLVALYGERDLGQHWLR